MNKRSIHGYMDGFFLFSSRSEVGPTHQPTIDRSLYCDEVIHSFIHWEEPIQQQWNQVRSCMYVWTDLSQLMISVEVRSVSQALTG
mmetsp:Transcript_18998/g.26154  ORF Transcript_18998/g.26154 Transcript_18998/m.26154 type:complete len:86 (+) Transcript_18998:79-336(+)